MKTENKKFWSFIIYGMYAYTLTCQIIVQDHLIVQLADFSEIDKHVDFKAVQEGFFLIYIGENQVLKENISEIDKREGPNKVVQVFFSPKINKICCTIIWQVRVCKVYPI